MSRRLRFEPRRRAATQRHPRSDRANPFLRASREPSTHRSASRRDLFNLVVIGEAAARLSKELRDEAPEVPWVSVIGLRNLLAHEYFRIDTAIVHEIIETPLAELDQAVTRLLESRNQPST